MRPNIGAEVRDSFTTRAEHSAFCRDAAFKSAARRREMAEQRKPLRGLDVIRIEEMDGFVVGIFAKPPKKRK